MKTKIAQISKNQITIGSGSIDEVIRHMSIAHVLMMLNGSKYDGNVERMIEAMAVGFCDHGLSPPSTIACRLAASCDSDLSKSLIAALACMGDTHAPITKAMEFQAGWVIGDILPKRVPGFGHPIHDVDPRVEVLISMAVDLFSIEDLPHVERAMEIEKMLSVRLNYAGVVAAICLDLGIKPPFAMLIAILGRFLGLTAHYVEQGQQPQKVICYDEHTSRFLD